MSEWKSSTFFCCQNVLSNILYCIQTHFFIFHFIFFLFCNSLCQCRYYCFKQSNAFILLILSFLQQYHHTKEMSECFLFYFIFIRKECWSKRTSMTCQSGICHKKMVIFSSSSTLLFFFFSFSLHNNHHRPLDITYCYYENKKEKITRGGKKRCVVDHDVRCERMKK